MRLDIGSLGGYGVETKPTNGTEMKRRTWTWSKLFQPLLIAACLFLWLVLTPTGQLVQVVVWWKTLSPQEVNMYCAGLSIAAALLHLLIFRKSSHSNG